MSMTTPREWIVICQCPDCDVPLADEVSRVQEQHFTATDKMEEVTYMCPSIMGGGTPLTCPKCGVRHDTRRLTPQLIAVVPGTKTPLSRRKGNSYGYRVDTWYRIVDALAEKRDAVLISKILVACRSRDIPEIVDIELTTDDEFHVANALRETTIPPTSG
jgi:hypothetical protein